MCGTPRPSSTATHLHDDTNTSDPPAWLEAAFLGEVLATPDAPAAAERLRDCFPDHGAELERLDSDIARDARFSTPLTAAALQQYLAASGMGLGREDDAAVAKVYARNAGLTLPGQSS